MAIRRNTLSNFSDFGVSTLLIKKKNEQVIASLNDKIAELSTDLQSVNDHQTITDKNLEKTNSNIITTVNKIDSTQSELSETNANLKSINQEIEALNKKLDKLDQN